MPLRIGASAIPENMAQVTLFQRKGAEPQGLGLSLRAYL